MNATTSAPTRQVKRRPKAQRLVRLLITPEGKAPGVVRLTVGETAVDYFLTAIPADFGKGFVVEKIGLDCPQGKYHVNIDGDQRSCECKGFLRHSRCKHADGLAALVARGQV